MRNVKFKSLPKFYVKEYKGIKPYTVRKIDMGDKRFRELFKASLNFKESDSYNCTIELENTETGGIFKEEITDISWFGDLVCIGWARWWE